MHTSSFQGIREYYYVYGVIIWNTSCELEEHLNERVQSILDKLDEFDKSEVSRASVELHYLQVQTANTFRCAMLPRFLGLMERIVKGMCRIVDSGVSKALDQRDWIRSHFSFLEGQGVDLTSIRYQIEILKELSTLRNCIVHANGEINACKSPEKVKQTIRKIETAEESKDGFVMLGDQVIPIAQIANSEILRYLFNHFGAPLDWRRWG